MTFDPFASIAIICVLLIIVVIVQALMINKVSTRGDKVQAALINKLMSKDFKDYSQGEHLIDLGLAAQVAAAKKEKKDPEAGKEYDEGTSPDEVPVI